MEKHSDLGYLIKEVVNKVIARKHMNRMRRASNMQAGRRDPVEGMIPYSFRMLRNVLDSRGSGKERGFKLRSVESNGYIWIGKTKVSEVVIVAYDLKISRRQARNETRCRATHQEQDPIIYIRAF